MKYYETFLQNFCQNQQKLLPPTEVPTPFTDHFTNELEKLIIKIYIYERFKLIK